MSRGEYSNALTLLVRAHTGAEKVLKRSWSFWGIDKDKYKECYLTATYVAVCYRALGKKDNASIYVDKALDYFDKYSKAYIDGFSTESGGMNFGPPGMRNPIRGFSDEERSEAKREMAEEKARIKKLPKQVASLK